MSISAEKHERFLCVGLFTLNFASSPTTPKLLLLLLLLLPDRGARILVPVSSILKPLSRGTYWALATLTNAAKLLGIAARLLTG